MPAINFSHNYPKLWNQTKAWLADVAVIPVEDKLHPDLIEYDTKTTEGEYYELPKGTKLFLLFVGEKKIPFCTIRRYTLDKFNWYFQQKGNLFDINIANGKNK